MKIITDSGYDNTATLIINMGDFTTPHTFFCYSWGNLI